MSLGKIRQRPVRRRWLFGITVTALAVFAALFIASASGTPPAECSVASIVVPGSPSCFESGDGNMKVDVTGANDWASVKSNAAYFHKVDVSSSQSDDSFVSGQKQDTTCPDTYLHGNPPKDDFTDIASYNELASNGDEYLYGATIRYTANGSASENVELKQSSVLCPGQPTGGVTVRTDGDKLLAIDYHPSAAPDFHVLTWITDNTSEGPCFVSNDVAPCWGAAVTTLLSNGANGLTNQTTIPSGENSIQSPAQSLVAGQFAEFGVNLRVAGIVPANTCKAFPQTVWESRSSGSSFVSTTKDISIENKTISNCGEIRIIKQTNPRGGDNSFSFSSNLPTESATTSLVGATCTYTSAVAADGSFSLNDKNNANQTADTDCAHNDQSNTVDEPNLFGGTTYTVTEGAPVSPYGFGSVSCSGGSGVTTDQTARSASIPLNAGDIVTCLFTNNLLKGALKISKLSAKTGNAVLKAGAVFCYDGTTGCGGTGHAGTSVTDNGSGDSDTAIGSVCVPNLTVGTYYVNETSPPPGYAGPVSTDATDQSVTVVGGTNCDTGAGANPPGAGATATFHDPPLADVQIRWKDDGSGELSLDGTVANGLSCTAGSATTGTQDRTDTTGWKNTLLVPNIQVTSGSTPNVTLTCTVKIDP
jgi:hypothetical protein